MAKTHSMTLGQFEARLKQQVEDFFATWRNSHKKAPEDFPLEFSGPAKSSALLEWEDQFRAWMEQQEI